MGGNAQNKPPRMDTATDVYAVRKVTCCSFFDVTIIQYLIESTTNYPVHISKRILLPIQRQSRQEVQSNHTNKVYNETFVIAEEFSI